MKTKTQVVRSFLPILIAGFALILGAGCATQERFYSLTQAPDGKFYTPEGNRRFPSAATVKVENTLGKEIAVFAREDRIITIVPPHQLRTVEVALDYNQQNYRLVLFAKIVDDTMQGKELAKQAFSFSNYYYDPVYGPGWGAARPETKLWVIRQSDFRLQDGPQGIFAPRPLGNNGGFNWFR
jgi:hypothetical protein